MGNKRITARSVAALAEGQSLADAEVRGFIARRLPGPSGGVTFGYRHRHGGRQRWLALGVLGRVTADQARDAAKRAAGQVAAGNDPCEQRKQAKDAAVNSVGAVIDSWLALYAKPRGLRTAATIERNLNRLVKPRLGSKAIYDLRRSDIVGLHDEIVARGAPKMAALIVKNLQSVLRWQSLRDDRFSPPLTPGLTRASKGEPRSRVLNDGEIRDVWRGLDAIDAEMPSYARLVKALLLTARRRDELGRAAWHEVVGNVVLIVPASRHKNGSELLMPITDEVLALFGPRPPVGGYIFGIDGTRPFVAYSRAKRALDAAIAEPRKAEGKGPMAPWRLHDLRRTARTLLSRAGVSADIGERCLGHAIPGVRGVYDCHPYEAEVRDALEKLAALVARIIDPARVVVEFPAARTR